MTFDLDLYAEMNPWRTALLLLIYYAPHSQEQLTVEIRELDTTNKLSSYSVLASYTFPSGFSSPFDWYTEPYTHLPPGGLTGVLSHPQPNDACSPIEAHPQTACEELCNNGNNNSLANKTTHISQHMNLSSIAIVDGYHRCTTKKLEHVQDAGFDAMITFSFNDGSRAVTSRVYDETMNTYVDIPSEEFPVVVVSETFASVLITNATSQQCTSKCWHGDGESVVLVHIESNDSRQGWIQFGISAVLVLLVIGLPILLTVCVCVCCYCVCSGRCFCCEGLSVCHCQRCCSCHCRKSGAYEVHELQVRELGEGFASAQEERRSQTLEETSSTPRLVANDEQHEQFRLTFENPRACVRRKFDCEKESSVLCAICLEEFNQDEEVDVLPCDDSHIFHLECIQQWLETHTLCPVCRYIIVEPSY